MASSDSLTPLQSRTLGALLGVHAGDSLGATLEFKTHAWILENHPLGLRDIIGGGPFNWPPGHATDDTDMTRAILLAYQDRQDLLRKQSPGDGAAVRGDGKEPDIVYLAANRFLDWFTGSPWPDRSPGSRPVDIGGATYTGLTKYTSSHDPYTSGAGLGSAGNGSLMRCIPTALFESDPEARVRDSMLISAVTHDDPRCTVSCAAYNTMVAELVKGASPGDAVAAGGKVIEDIKARNPADHVLISGADEVLRAIETARTLSISSVAQHGPSDSLPGKGSGYVLESLILAVAAVLDPRKLDDVLVDVVRVGKDTDTNGAVAGGLLGARDGIEGIPEMWREVLQFDKEFTRIALELIGKD